MKRSIILFTLALSAPAWAAPAEQAKGTPSPQALRQQRAFLGDEAGGRFIPQPVLDILADPHLDPNVAYLLWQLSRKPVGDWTLAELGLVAQIAPTTLEASLSVTKIQTLYQFWGLDPNDIFNVSLAPNWQSQSTAFSTADEGNVAAISSAECQADVSQLTVSTFKACTTGR